MTTNQQAADNENRRHLRPLDVLLAILLATIAAVPPSIFALAAYSKAGETHDLVNSRMTEMLGIYTKAATDAATLAERIRIEQIKLQQSASPVVVPPIVMPPIVLPAPAPVPTVKETK